MSYTLKSSGIATNLTMCLAVDDDGTTFKEFCNASVDSGKTFTGAGYSQNSRTWNGHTVVGKYRDTSFAPAVDFPTTRPATTAPGSVVVMVSNQFNQANSRSIVHSVGTVFQLYTGAGGTINLDLAGSLTLSGTTVPTTGNAYLIAGAWGTGASHAAKLWYGAAGGVVATEATTTTSSETTIDSIDHVGWSGGGGSFDAEILAYLLFNKELSEAELNGLLSDPYGTLFAGTPILDEDGEWVITTQSW